MCEKVSSGIFGQPRPRSPCASCPLKESLDTKECINGEQKPGWDFAHVQDDVNLHILRMLKALFRLTQPISVFLFPQFV